MTPDPSRPTLDVSPSAIAKSVHDTLNEAVATIPDGKDAAFLIDGTITADGQPAAQVVFATRAGKNWTFSTGGAWDGHHVTGKVALAGSWNWHD